MLDPIRPGDRGPAVEDVQQRLLVLGHDLGPTGIDGVFLGATHTAVCRFQSEHGLAEDGIIGPETWAALVDATFTLGDRLLYLRFPYLHGADVRRLQGALNALGFACGTPDGIFGRFTERAVREFQANVGLPADGIVGPDTVRAVEHLRHVWEGKDPASPLALAVAPARAAHALRQTRVTVTWAGPCGKAVAERFVNLAEATDPDALVALHEGDAGTSAGIVVRVMCDLESVSEGSPVVDVTADTPAEGRFITAFAAVTSAHPVVVMVPADAADDERTAQACAVRMLDGVCAALSGNVGPVVP